MFQFPVPMLDKLVIKMDPVVAKATPYAAVYKLNILSATGTAIFLAAADQHDRAGHARAATPPRP